MSADTIADVWTRSQTVGLDRLVLLVIADHVAAEADELATDLTVATIMQRSGLGERTVQRAVRNLERAGELLVLARPGKPNRQVITLDGDGLPLPDLDPDGLHNRRTALRSRQRRIWDRDGWWCQVSGPGCTGHMYLTIGHIIPVNDEGPDDDDNVQTECLTCNDRKGARHQ